MELRTTRITGLEQLWVTRARAAQTRTENQAAQRESSRVRISEQADLLNQMASLKSNDPGRFKEVVGSVSQNLTAAAQNPAAGEINTDLSKLARQLELVAKTGDLRKMEAPNGKATTNRAIEAYLKNARPAPPPSETARQALQYVLNTIDEANQGVGAAEPTSGAR
ncbi:MAG TPA: hypothetical protein VI299_21765 [Polyangiales bacterium]